VTYSPGTRLRQSGQRLVVDDRDRLLEDIRVLKV